MNTRSITIFKSIISPSVIGGQFDFQPPTMSWLARSIANSLQIDEEDEDDRPTTSNDVNSNHPRSVENQEFDPDQEGSDPQTLTGVKEDLSEFKDSLARQIWGVASFLAPIPQPPPPPQLPIRHRSSTITQPDDPDPTVSDRHRGDSSVSCDADDDLSNSVLNDSKFGGATGVSHSSTFQTDDQEETDKGFVGVTEEVLAFAMNIAHHPETWLDFPLSEEEDNDDFEMSDTQWNHATLVEHLVPRLSALRIELCPVHMSESYFWKVYFVLLHPRLNKHDACLLSTPQIVAARSMWIKELQMQTKIGQLLSERNNSHKLDTSHEEHFNTILSESPCASMLERTTHVIEPKTHQTVAEKQPVLTKDGSTKGVSDQRVVSSFTIPIENFGDDEDDWIHENSELDGYDGPDVPIGDEDISFSDLEDDDDDCTIPVRSNIV